MRAYVSRNFDVTPEVSPQAKIKTGGPHKLPYPHKADTEIPPKSKSNSGHLFI